MVVQPYSKACHLQTEIDFLLDLLCLFFFLYHGLKRHLSCYKKAAVVITSDNINGD